MRGTTGGSLSYLRGRTAHSARAEARRSRALLVMQPHHVLLERTLRRVARRVAIDLRRLDPLVPHTSARQLLQAIHANALHRQDRLLRLRPSATIVSDLAIGAHHP